MSPWRDEDEEAPARSTRPRHFAQLEQSPLVITMNAIAADVMTMRTGPVKVTRKELLAAMMIAATLANEKHRNAEESERELLRVAALAVRCIEER